MPSSPPGPGNNYLVTRETLLDEATLNAILSSIGSRLTAREALEATFQTLIDAGVAQAVEIAQNELGPIVEDAQSARDTLLAWVAAGLVASFNGRSGAVTFTTADLTAALNALPTSLPATPGQWWVNDGVLMKS